MSPLPRGFALRFVVLALLVLAGSPACAGRLQRADLERLFPPPYILGEKDDARRSGRSSSRTRPRRTRRLCLRIGRSRADPRLFRHADRSSRRADARGRLSRRESDLAARTGVRRRSRPEPLFEFVKQYPGKSLKQSIKVGPPGRRCARRRRGRDRRRRRQGDRFGAHPQRVAAGRRPRGRARQARLRGRARSQPRGDAAPGRL